MPRFKPLTIKLPITWRKTTLAKVRASLKIKAGSVEDKRFVGILDHPKTEEAVKYLEAASNGDPRLRDRVISAAFMGCLAVRKMVAISSDEAATVAAMAMLIRETLEKIGSDHSPLVRSLHAAENVLSGFSRGRKVSSTGRPPKAHRTLLMLMLPGLFNLYLRRPVNHAVAALVTATFPEEKPLTKQDLLSRRSRRKAKKTTPGRTFLTQG